MPNQPVPGYQGGFVRGGFGGGVPGQDLVRQLQQQLMQAQMMGANPMVIGDLQLKLQNAMQDQQRSNQMNYMQALRRNTTAGPVGRAYSSGIDPWVSAMLGLQYGVGGGNSTVG